ncbi:MAG TPA: hypothetical protein VGX78_12715, partial [Pirellulales bacterium]|nr:hypothetical protein [Pirellulales bacterium]
MTPSTPKRRAPQRLRTTRKPPLSLTQILAWADAHFERTGHWPGQDSGLVGDAFDTRWKAIDKALREGLRGLPGGASLAKLLAERRGVRNRGALPHFTEAKILEWTDAHHLRTGEWPKVQSGPIADAPGETWLAVDSALRAGKRGLEGGSSLAQVLTERRGVRNEMGLPPLATEQVLAWADDFV